MTEERNWLGTTYGRGWMHRALICILRYVDVRVIYGFVSVFVIPFCLLFGHTSKFTFRYFAERWRCPHTKAFCMAYKNYCLFAQAVIDKFAMYAGKKFDIQIEGLEYFTELANGERGFVQLSAHIGNYEIAGYSLVSYAKTINALVYGGEKESVMDNRVKIFQQTHTRIVPISNDMSHIFSINAALDRNEIVSMPADRLMGSQKTIEMSFLGAPAKFPVGPFVLAAMHKVDVVAINVMKTKPKQYTVYVHPILYDKTVPRSEQIRQMAEGYVDTLTQLLTLYPTQWYNYFEFWDN